jgi:hypothetical protein
VGHKARAVSIVFIITNSCVHCKHHFQCVVICVSLVLCLLSMYLNLTESYFAEVYGGSREGTHLL